MFLGLEDGTVDCFDLDRGIISPYRIRNLWFEQEALYRKSGAPGAPSARHIPMCTDIKIHPYDINLILIAHEGGISLYNVKQEHVVRTFQLIIPPGAIGGSSDPNDPSIFEDRRPKVNCLCFRPDGLMIAAGYSDGCIAFWSINDGEIPVTVRTIDRENASPLTGKSQPTLQSLRRFHRLNSQKESPYSDWRGVILPLAQVTILINRIRMTWPRTGVNWLFLVAYW
ncbi:hypothetical protein Pst134EB_001959 [Puccinia striiformis f. sp. tritici]|nr:hypothetical protein Pst134EB_001959 [Puccinia striiformis f. sp. tritici]